jgi:hypothetical protein
MKSTTKIAWRVELVKFNGMPGYVNRRANGSIAVNFDLSDGGFPAFSALEATLAGLLAQGATITDDYRVRIQSARDWVMSVGDLIISISEENTAA